MTYWFRGEGPGKENDYTKRAVHKSRFCSELGAPKRPLADSTVETENLDICPACDPDQSTDDADATDADVSGTCDTIKSDGDVCGRERPCPYHD